MSCADVDSAYLGRRFVCPGCSQPSARPADVTSDAASCSDVESCGWTGTLGEAQELD